MSSPELKVTATVIRSLVTILPIGHPDYRRYSVTVKRRWRRNALLEGDYRWVIEKDGEYLEWMDIFDIQWGADARLFDTEEDAMNAAAIVLANMRFGGKTAADILELKY